MAVVTAPPGCGKTVLLRSWIGAAGLAERVAWVPVGRNERDPQRLWLAVLDALRQTALLWLVVDDAHELDSDLARRQLELLVMRPPERLRFVLATRHDVRMGLHRLRLEGDLAEIRADDLLPRRGRCSRRPAWSWPTRRWRRCMSVRRGGPGDCG